MENNTSNQRTERILGSLDGLQKAAAPDFFYTRLAGRMQQETGSGEQSFFLLRPAFIAAALSVVFVVNIVSLLKLGGQATQNESTHINKPASIESFATAYDMNSTSVYE